MRWFQSHLPQDGNVQVKAFGTDLCGLSIAGPNSRELLSRLTNLDVSNEAMPFLTYKEMDIGLVPAKVGRITFTGDLGYEIWVPASYLTRLHDTIVEAGADLGLKHVGSRALMSLRLEKNWGTWAREYRPIYGPYEAQMGRFVSLKKNEFIGHEAARQEKQDRGQRA